MANQFPFFTFRMQLMWSRLASIGKKLKTQFLILTNDDHTILIKKKTLYCYKCKLINFMKQNCKEGIWLLLYVCMQKKKKN
jgi:hypothetical protein